MELRNAFLAAAFLTILSGLAGVGFTLGKKPLVERPSLGNRGLQRARALQASSLFATAEPVIRYFAAWICPLPLGSLRPALRRALAHSGDYFGLSEDEVLASSGLVGVSLGVIALYACTNLELPLVLAFVGLLLGALLPWFRLVAIARERAKRVDRELPAAVDLAAMCMNAGLDFPGSLRRIVDSAADPQAPIIEEFNRILQELDLGHTRRHAMESFERRVPTDQVRELVNGVVQAEDKGSPLTPVLAIQAQTQRLRRTIAAEVTASEAALMLMGPMTLIFLCVIVLLLGPVVVRFMTGGLGPA